MRRMLFAMIFLPLGVLAQDLPPLTQQQLENLSDENLEDDALLQILAYYRQHPLNLNTAGAEELTSLRLLNALQITALIRHRLVFGPLLNLHELQAVVAFDLPTIHRLRPFVTVNEAGSLQENLRVSFRNSERYALLRFARILERPTGYDNKRTSHYLGDRNRLLLAIRGQYKTQLYYGLVADKDAGEPFMRREQKRGFDFYAAHLFLRRLGRVKALAIGDYAVNLGQGLTQWQSLAFGKSADALAIKRQSPVLLPYRSSGEFLFNRGAGLTVNLGACELTGFVSYKKFSGNLITDSLPRFSSFNVSGYHRTPAEQADRYRLTDFSAGGNLSFNRRGWHVGFNTVWHRFSRPLQKSSEPYNYYALNGRESVNVSGDYNFTYKNAHVFGEIATDKMGHLAAVNGMLVSLERRVDLSLLHRHFSPAYQSLFGNAFSENNLPSNENGFYAGLVLRPAAGWQVSAYADVYRFPFLKYRVSAPGSGHDYLAQVSWQPSKQTQVYLRLRSEEKALNETTSDVIRFPDGTLRQNLRFHIATQLTPSLQLRTRVETTRIKTKAQLKEEGFLGYVEVAKALPLIGNLTTRLQYFETDGFDSRVYAYESDVLYAFSTPAFYGKGLRFYVIGEVNLLRNLSLWLRFAQTRYRDQTSVGTGLDTIYGNHKSDVHLQLRYIF